ncbi:MAG: PKD domain-containing protein [bacterium]
MRDFRFRPAMALLLLLLTASCTGSTALREPGQSPADGPEITQIAAGLPENGFPDSLPADGQQPWENLDINGFVAVQDRTAASINPQTEFTPGVERFLAGGDVADNAEASRINGTDASAASYAMYRVSLGGSQPGIVSIDANLLSGSGYYVGFSNYGTGRWDWRGPFTDNHIRLQAALKGSDNLLSALGNTFVSVLCPSGSSADLIGVGVNSLELADAVAPAQVTGLSLTPVAGGIELAWAPLLEPDLAGYLVLYSTAAFTDPDAAAVRRLPYLEGSTRQLLSDLSTETFVAVSALDFAGNFGQLSELQSATPLVGTAPALQLTADAVSAPLNDAITLNANGAASYDWDLDGDGVFEVLADGSGKQQADTSSAGLLRPRVRGTDGEATALGGVSLIVTGNTRPVASATAVPQSGTAPLNVTFSAEADDLEDGPGQLSYAWDFDGDGIYEPDTDSLSPDPVDYVDPGLYNAKFRVTDSEGAWDVDTLAVQVSPADVVNLPPVVAFSFDSQHGDSEGGIRKFYMPQDDDVELFLDATGSLDPEGGSLTYHFDALGYGEFESQSGAFYTATYTEPGIYKPTLMVEDPDGNTAEASFLIRIYRFSSQELTPHGTNVQATSMAVIGGLPAIIYRDSGEAWYTHALDVRGENWSEPVLAASTDQGTSELSLLEVDGLPAFAQALANNIVFVRALVADGSSWSAPVTVEDHATDSLLYPNMAIVGGRPAISYYQNTTEKVRYARAGDASGTTWSLLTDVDTDVGTQTTFTRLAVVAGRPAILYWHSDDSDLFFLRAEDSTGTDWDSNNRALVHDNSGNYFDLKVAAGIPVVAFDNFDPYFCAATNTTGSSWNTPVRVDPFNGGNNHGDYIRLLVTDDHMAIFNYDLADDDIRMSYSASLSGDSWPSFDILVDGLGDAGRNLGAAVLDGRPAVCYEGNDEGVLRFAWPQLN